MCHTASTQHHSGWKMTLCWEMSQFWGGSRNVDMDYLTECLCWHYIYRMWHILMSLINHRVLIFFSCSFMGILIEQCSFGIWRWTVVSRTELRVISSIWEKRRRGRSLEYVFMGRDENILTVLALTMSLLLFLLQLDIKKESLAQFSVG